MTAILVGGILGIVIGGVLVYRQGMPLSVILPLSGFLGCIVLALAAIEWWRQRLEEKDKS